MSELAKAYEPQAVEAKWYAAWIDGKCFEADPSSAWFQELGSGFKVGISSLFRLVRISSVGIAFMMSGAVRAESTAPVSGVVNAPRKWTGRNGKTFEGRLNAVLVDPGQVIVTPEQTGRPLVLEVEKLSDADADWLASIRPVMTREIPPVSESKNSGNAAGFREELAVARDAMIEHDFERENIKFEEYGVQGVCEVILWWDEIGLLAVPKGKTYAEKAKWLERRFVTSYWKSNSSSANGILNCFQAYFSNELKDQAVLNTNSIQLGQGGSPGVEFSLERLSEFATGVNGVIIELISVENGRDKGWLAFPVITADPNGTCLLRIDGKNVPAVIKATGGKGTNGRPVWMLEITDLAKAPGWMSEKKASFRIYDIWSGGIAAVIPHVFRIPGRISPAPVDEMLVRLPLERSLKDSYLRRNGGGQEEGVMEAAGETGFWLRDERRTLRKFDYKDFYEGVFHDARVWRAVRGQRVDALTAGTFRASVELPGLRGTRKLRVSIAFDGNVVFIEKTLMVRREKGGGSTVWEDDGGAKSGVCIDLGDGAFVASDTFKAGGTVKRIGRYRLEALLGPHDFSGLPHGDELAARFRRTLVKQAGINDFVTVRDDHPGSSADAGISEEVRNLVRPGNWFPLPPSKSSDGRVRIWPLEQMQVNAAMRLVLSPEPMKDVTPGQSGTTMDSGPWVRSSAVVPWLGRLFGLFLEGKCTADEIRAAGVDYDASGFWQPAERLPTIPDEARKMKVGTQRRLDSP